MRSVKMKMCVFFGLLMLLSGLLFAWEAVEQSRGALVGFLGEQSSRVVKDVSKEIDSEKIASVLRAVEEAKDDEGKLRAAIEMPEYKEIYERMSLIRAAAGLEYLYTLATTSDGVHRYLVDGSDLNDAEKFSPPGSKVNVDDEMRTAFSSGELVQSDIVFDPDYGNLIISYLPIKDRSGKVMFLIGGDFSADRTLEIANALRIKILILVALILVVSLILTYFAAGIISAPILRLVEMVKRVRGGDVSFARADFKVKTKDEIGTMADELAEMVEAQKQFILRTKEAADSALVQSQELNSRSSDSTRAVEAIDGAVKNTYKNFEASSAVIEESNAGTQEISASASEIAKATRDGAELSTKIREFSQKAMSESKEALQNIRISASKSDESGHAMEELIKTVDSIGTFMAKIRSIAYQTNLLALNAAIEAARAGDAGRGFGVVADSVRKLAEESGVASKEVDALIDGLIQVSKRSQSLHVQSQEELGKALKETEVMADLSVKTEKEISSLDKIIHDIAQTTEKQESASREIAGSLSVAAREMSNIQENIEKIKQNTEETDNIAGEVVKIAEQLAQQNAALHELMKFYKTA